MAESIRRAISSIRRECLNHFVILNARHLTKTLALYFRYYHESRPHLGLGKQCPFPRQVWSVACCFRFACESQKMDLRVDGGWRGSLHSLKLGECFAMEPRCIDAFAGWQIKS